MRLLRRRVGIITVFVLLVAPIAVSPAARSDKDRRPWATVNVCDTEAAPDTIGIRGSMPGSRNRRTRMYMRFVVQYYSREDKRWYRVGKAGDSGYLYVGRGRRTRQFGRSFRIEPVEGRPALLRGRVYFEWRLKGDVVRRASRRTRRGHRSSAGDDPDGYSASTCTISAEER